MLGWLARFPSIAFEKFLLTDSSSDASIIPFPISAHIVSSIPRNDVRTNELTITKSSTVYAIGEKVGIFSSPFKHRILMRLQAADLIKEEYKRNL